jgi:hypothetical protein
MCVGEKRRAELISSLGVSGALLEAAGGWTVVLFEPTMILGTRHRDRLPEIRLPISNVTNRMRV